MRICLNDLTRSIQKSRIALGFFPQSQINEEKHIDENGGKCKSGMFQTLTYLNTCDTIFWRDLDCS